MTARTSSGVVGSLWMWRLMCGVWVFFLLFSDLCVCLCVLICSNWLTCQPYERVPFSLSNPLLPPRIVVDVRTAVGASALPFRGPLPPPSPRPTGRQLLWATLELPLSLNLTLLSACLLFQSHTPCTCAMLLRCGVVHPYLLVSYSLCHTPYGSVRCCCVVINVSFLCHTPCSYLCDAAVWWCCSSSNVCYSGGGGVAGGHGC